MDRQKIQDTVNEIVTQQDRQGARDLLTLLTQQATLENLGEANSEEVLRHALDNLLSLLDDSYLGEIVLDKKMRQFLPDRYFNEMRDANAGNPKSHGGGIANVINNTIQMRCPCTVRPEAYMGKRIPIEGNGENTETQEPKNEEGGTVEVDEGSNEQNTDTGNTDTDGPEDIPEEIIPNTVDNFEALLRDVEQHARNRGRIAQQRSNARIARPNPSQAPLASNQAARAEDSAEQRGLTIAELIEDYLDIDTPANRESIRVLIQEERDLWETERESRQQEQTAIIEENHRNIEQHITANEQERATNLAQRQVAQNSRTGPYSRLTEDAMAVESETEQLEREVLRLADIRRQNQGEPHQQNLLDLITRERAQRNTEQQARLQENIALTRSAIDQQIINNRTDRDANRLIRNAIQRPPRFVNAALSQAAIIAENATFAQEGETETVIQIMEADPTPENIELVEVAIVEEIRLRGLEQQARESEQEAIESYEQDQMNQEIQQRNTRRDDNNIAQRDPIRNSRPQPPLIESAAAIAAEDDTIRLEGITQGYIDRLPAITNNMTAARQQLRQAIADEEQARGIEQLARVDEQLALGGSEIQARVLENENHRRDNNTRRTEADQLRTNPPSPMSANALAAENATDTAIQATDAASQQFQLANTQPNIAILGTALSNEERSRGLEEQARIDELNDLLAYEVAQRGLMGSARLQARTARVDPPLPQSNAAVQAERQTEGAEGISVLAGANWNNQQTHPNGLALRRALVDEVRCRQIEERERIAEPLAIGLADRTRLDQEVLQAQNLRGPAQTTRADRVRDRGQAVRDTSTIPLIEATERAEVESRAAEQATLNAIQLVGAPNSHMDTQQNRDAVRAAIDYELQLRRTEELAAITEAAARLPLEIAQMQEAITTAAIARTAAREARQTARGNRPPRPANGYAEQVLEDAYDAEEDSMASERAAAQAELAFGQAQTPQTIQTLRQDQADELRLRNAEQAARGLETAHNSQETAERARLVEEIIANQTARTANAEQRKARRIERRSAMRTPNPTTAANNAERATAAAENASDTAIGNWRSTNGTLQAARTAINAEIQLRAAEKAARDAEVEARNHATAWQRISTTVRKFGTEGPSEAEKESRAVSSIMGIYRNKDLNLTGKFGALAFNLWTSMYWGILDGVRRIRRR